MSSIQELSDEDLQRLVSCAGRPIIIACFTQSCVPCKRMLPILEDLRRKFSDGLRIVRADVEKYPTIAAKYDVACVPTLLIITNERVRARIVGIVAWKDLVNKIFMYSNL